MCHIKRNKKRKEKSNMKHKGNNDFEPENCSLSNHIGVILFLFLILFYTFFYNTIFLSLLSIFFYRISLSRYSSYHTLFFSLFLPSIPLRFCIKWTTNLLQHRASISHYIVAITGCSHLIQAFKIRDIVIYQRS